MALVEGASDVFHAYDVDMLKRVWRSCSRGTIRIEGAEEKRFRGRAHRNQKRQWVGYMSFLRIMAKQGFASKNFQGIHL